MASSLVNNKYRITRRIGGGSFGEIYMGIGPNNEKVRDVRRPLWATSSVWSVYWEDFIVSPNVYSSRYALLPYVMLESVLRISIEYETNTIYK